MNGVVFFVEIILVFGLVIGWAVWEYLKISRLAKKSRAEAARSDGVSETAAGDEPE